MFIHSSPYLIPTQRSEDSSSVFFDYTLSPVTEQGIDKAESMVGSRSSSLSLTKAASSQAVKCSTLRINQGLPSSTAVKANYNIPMKVRSSLMEICSRPRSLRLPSMSHSLALLNNLSTLHLFLNSFTSVRNPSTL